MPDLEWKTRPPLENEQLNVLFATAWKGHQATDFGPILQRSLTWIAAFSGPQLVGFVNVAWDGGVHAFLLDTTVHQDFQGQGIGRELVQRAVQEARVRGCHWLHVDFEPQLEGFYRACGFQDTRAGLLRLNPAPSLTINP